MKMIRCVNVVMAALLVMTAHTVALYAQSDLEQAKAYVEGKDYLAAAPFVLSAVKKEPNNLEALLLAGDVYRELEKLDSALGFYQRAEKIEDEPLVLRKVAAALSELGRHKEAVAKALQAVDDDKKDVYNHIVLGQVYINADSLQKADLVIRRAQTLNKDIPDTYVALGDLYFAQKVYELAKMNYDEAASRDPSLLEPRIKLARANFKLANAESDSTAANELFSESLRAWDEVTRLDTNNAPAFFEKGRILFFSRQYVEAARSLYRYTTLRPEGQIGRWYLAQAFYEIRAYDSAEVQLKQITIDSVQDKKASMLARSHFETKEFAEAKQLYMEMKAANQMSLEDMERFGYAAILSGDTTTALNAFKEAINANPKNCTLMFRVGNLFRQRQAYDDAIAILRKRLENCQDSLSATTRYLIGVSFYSAGKLDSAIVEYQQAIQTDAMVLQPYIDLGRAYYEAKSTDSANSILSKAIEVARQNPTKYKREIEQIFSVRAGNYFETKDYGNLKKMTSEWLEIAPDSEFGNLYKAIAHQGLNEKDDACRHYRQVLKINPNSKPAKDNMSNLGCK